MVHLPTPPSPTDASPLPQRRAEGDLRPLEEVTPVVRGELKRPAHLRLCGECLGHTLNTTGLVHEAYLRQADVERARWADRNHLLCMAPRVMRRILVDHVALEMPTSGAVERRRSRSRRSTWS